MPLADLSYVLDIPRSILVPDPMYRQFAVRSVQRPHLAEPPAATKRFVLHAGGIVALIAGTIVEGHGAERVEAGQRHLEVKDLSPVTPVVAATAPRTWAACGKSSQPPPWPGWRSCGQRPDWCSRKIPSPCSGWNT